MPQRIPKHFHFVFGLKPQTKPFELMHYLCLASCMEVNQPERITLYCHYMPHGPYWECIRERLEVVQVALPTVVNEYEYADPELRPLRYAHLADFVRLDQLIEYGGVYADIDTLFLKPIPEEYFDASFVIGREPDVFDAETQTGTPSLCNALLMSEPQAPFAIAWRDGMEDAFDGTWSNHSTLLPARLSEQHPDWVRVVDQDVFYSVAPSPTALFCLFEDDGPSRNQFPPEACSIHLWEHLWRDEGRQDFSMFHLGLLSEEYVRSGRTMYAAHAAAYLPPPSPPAAPQAKPWLPEAKEWLRALGGVALLPVLRALGFRGGHLGLARGYFASRAATRSFQTRGSWDRLVMRWVLRWDEYGVLEMGLGASDAVIDVGGHIGSFTFAAWWAGSRRICTFEPDPENFTLLDANTGRLAGVTLQQAALVRGDLEAGAVELARYNGNNTGSSSVLFGGDREVPARSVDTLLRELGSVRLLKLDCEGSEFPILLTSRELARVQMIVGEYHEVPAASMNQLAVAARVEGVDAYDAGTLGRHLQAAGFQFTSRATDRGIGTFRAVRV